MNSINFFNKKTNKMHTYVQKIVSFFNSHPLIKFAVKTIIKVFIFHHFQGNIYSQSHCICYYFYVYANFNCPFSSSLTVSFVMFGILSATHSSGRFE